MNTSSHYKPHAWEIEGMKRRLEADGLVPLRASRAATIFAEAGGDVWLAVVDWVATRDRKP